ncbi:MAG: hypothetical protein KIT43_12695 [Bauldia sp.]|nr:hypothetical protein [Bauldia sp.]
MTEITNELIYEVLKRMQDRLTSLDRKVDEVKAELVAIRGHVVQLASQDARLERIDRPQDLIEPAPLS